MVHGARRTALGQGWMEIKSEPQNQGKSEPQNIEYRMSK